MEPAEILEKAADGLESGVLPWGQYPNGLPEEGTDTYCAVEALTWAMFGTKDRLIDMPRDAWAYNKATDAMVNVLRPRVNGVILITSWNDHQAKSAQDVADVMKEAAKNLRNAT